MVSFCCGGVLDVWVTWLSSALTTTFVVLTFARFHVIQGARKPCSGRGAPGKKFSWGRSITFVFFVFLLEQKSHHSGCLAKIVLFHQSPSFLVTRNAHNGDFGLASLAANFSNQTTVFVKSLRPEQFFLVAEAFAHHEQAVKLQWADSLQNPSFYRQATSSHSPQRLFLSACQAICIVEFFAEQLANIKGIPASSYGETKPWTSLPNCVRAEWSTGTLALRETLLSSRTKPRFNSIYRSTNRLRPAHHDLHNRARVPRWLSLPILSPFINLEYE